MPDAALPKHLQGTKHWDWPRVLQWVPRGWTSFDWGQPKIMAGSQKSSRSGAPLPIGEAGSWQISRFPNAPKPLCWLPLYFAWSTKTAKDGKFTHVRLGARYDDVDDYTTLPVIARRRYTGSDSQNTSTN